MAKFWQTPSNLILSTAETSDNTCEIFTTEYIENLFAFFGVSATVEDVKIAPQVVSYACNLKDARQAKKVRSMLFDLSIALKTDVTIQKSPLYSFIFVLCRHKRAKLNFETVLSSKSFCNFKGHLTALLGVTSQNEVLTVDIAKLPHLLIAGATGSGKSVALNSILCSILFQYSPSALRIMMIDTKKTELSLYEGIPHLMATPALDFETALYYLKETCYIMDERNAKMNLLGIKDITGSNFERILIVIDELADLMIEKNNKEIIEPYLIRLAQLGRSAGIHLIIATQRPTINVLTGLIKANIPARIALQCSSIRDSMTVLDHKGAEQLIGRGDAIIKLPSQVETIRCQFPFIADEDIRAVVNHWQNNSIKEVL